MVCIIIYVTFEVSFSTYMNDMDKPSWGWDNHEMKFWIWPLKWPLTVIFKFKNSNLQKTCFSWQWWLIVVNHKSVSKNRLRVSRRPETCCRTYSKAVWIEFYQIWPLNMFVQGYILNRSTRCFLESRSWNWQLESCIDTIDRYSGAQEYNLTYFDKKFTSSYRIHRFLK